MIRLGTLLGVARAEARLARRLVRYWVFMVISALLGLAGYGYYAFLHIAFSHYSATVASIQPRYLVAAIGFYYMFVFLFGLVFLGFDVRARDARERVAEVLDSRPLSNVELLLGKFSGLLVASWVPVVVVALLLAGIGKFIGEAIEPWSLVGFAVAMTLPAFSFTLGLVFFVTLLVRHRGLAGLLLLGAVAGIYFGIFLSPIYLMPVVDVTGAYITNFPSDILPGVADLAGWLQRGAVALIGLGFVWLAAAIHPRPDDGSRRMRAATGVGMCLVGVAICGAIASSYKGILDDKRAWRAAHEARRDDPAPDLRALSGKIEIDPGRELVEELTLEIAAPAGVTLERALFSLNPGLRVERVAAAAGGDLAFTFESGLLDVQLPAPLAPGQTTVLALVARGLPDSSFAYLDNVLEPLEVDPINGQIFLLGFESSIFDRRFVALMPGTGWLPASGAEIGRADPRVRPTDFFEVDLSVVVPEGWTVAGPGRRRETDGKAQRFAPGAPVPDVALIAGRFERRAAELDGVELEVLVHRSHAASVEFFADAADEVRDWLGERLEDARQAGLPYPYDGLSLVEVPMILRGYGGGWRLGSTLAQPGMVLMREASFPTARFDTPFKNSKTLGDREGGVPRAKRETLERFFENDFSGGNPFVGAARSFFSFQTAGSGPAGLPLDFVCEELSTQLVAARRGYFSAHVFNNKDIHQVVGQSIATYLSGQSSSDRFSDTMIQVVTSRVEIWDKILGVSLADLDPWDKPAQTVDVLTLKGGAMASSMLDGLGRERTGSLLADLRTRARGRAFTRDDVLAAGETVGENLDSWLGVWLDETALPGFRTGPVRFERITDGPDGSPRYQLAVTVRNAEPTPGLVRLLYDFSGEGGRGEERSSTAPVRVEGESAVEIGVVTSRPPRSVRVAPYLALNRDPFSVDLPALDEKRVIASEPLEGSRPVDWDVSDGAIVVDDLDDGFSVVDVEDRGWWRFGARSAEEATDMGLPERQFNQMPSRWSRQTSTDAWGRYRHTVAVVGKGTGARRAIFAAELPAPGRWQLELHLPARMLASNPSGRARVGTYNLAVIHSDGEEAVRFDAKGGEGGWNTIEAYDLPSGEVRVELSDESDGRLVVADAIRWTPSPGDSARAGSAP